MNEIKRSKVVELVEKSGNYIACGASGTGYEWSQLQFESTTQESVVIIINNNFATDGEFYISIEDYSDEDGETLDSFGIESVEEFVDMISNL